MKVNYETASILESIVLHLWKKCGKGALQGSICTAQFEDDPYLSTLFILFPFVYRDPSVEKDPTVSALCLELANLECTHEDRDRATPDECTKITQKSRELSDYLKAHFEPAE